jgi:hypothetical protein
MGNSLAEENIKKNKEFYKLVCPFLIASGVIAFVTFKFTPISTLINVLVVTASSVIAIGLLIWTFSGGKCPKCAARKHENRLSTELMKETFLGNKYVPGDKNSSGYTAAVFDREYYYHSICKYCDYEWTGTYTSRAEKRL